MATADASINATEDELQIAPDGKRLGLNMVLALGLRRNTTHCAQPDVRVMLLDERVYRRKAHHAEKVTADLYQFSACHFHGQMEQDVR